MKDRVLRGSHIATTVGLTVGGDNLLWRGSLDWGNWTEADRRGRRRKGKGLCDATRKKRVGSRLIILNRVGRDRVISHGECERDRGNARLFHENL